MTEGKQQRVCKCLVSWLDKCESALSSGTADILDLLDSLSVAWCGPAQSALNLLMQDTSEPLQVSEDPWTVLGDGLRCLEALGDAAEAGGVAFWPAVADDCELCGVLLNVWRALPPWRGPFAAGAGDAVAAAAERGVARVCTARGRAIALAGTLGADDWVYARETTLGAEAAAALCAAYEQRASAVPGALDLAGAVHVAFRGTPALVSVADALRARTAADPALNVANALVAHINRADAADSAAADADADEQWPCLCLATDLVEPPCAFSDNDLGVLVDVVLRQLEDAGAAARADAAVARLELVREAVLAPWFARDGRSRGPDIARVVRGVAAALAAAVPDGSPRATAASCLAREIVTAVEEEVVGDGDNDRTQC